ncbi:hypothetical protein [Chryseobacterium arthrosphaerae]|uniref:hypothetical protein n=1 Tax=Chryseobacterium arthrosphaerae TaxID=651561 RepID=UPI00241DCA41|nr:hypothetical protein [Chryseobacterium arthrosphaerae]
MKKIRVQFLLFVYDKTQKLYRKYFKKKKRQWQFNEKQLLEFQEDSLGRKLGEFYRKHGFSMIPKMENHDVHHLITGCGPTSKTKLPCSTFFWEMVSSMPTFWRLSYWEHLSCLNM